MKFEVLITLSVLAVWFHMWYLLWSILKKVKAKKEKDYRIDVILAEIEQLREDTFNDHKEIETRLHFVKRRQGK